MQTCLAHTDFSLTFATIFLQEEEVAQISHLLQQAQHNAEAARVREEEARAQGRELAERARRAEARAAEYEADIGQVRQLVTMWLRYHDTHAVQRHL